MTVVTTETELLAFFFKDTVATEVDVLSIHDAIPIWTVILRETTALLARLGQVPKTVPALLLADPPALGVAEIKAAPAGRGSVMSSPVLVDGPRLVTKTV